jgi:energy-coupling factor transporter ATP-binding protein EcfA2
MRTNTDTQAKVSMCPTRLVPDGVAQEDDFRHRDVATAIADMILTEPGCSIALTGSWGSGKSTVVEFLAEQLKERGGVETFVFDAWAHQGDPLRRSFLEKLIGWCGQDTRRWIEDTAFWARVVDELARRSETIETTSAPRLTRWGVAGALALLVVPVALQVYQKINYSYHPFWEWVAILASSLPIIVAALLFGTWCRAECKKSPKNRRPIPNLFFTSAENNITSTSSKTPDPTSVEFEEKYTRLLTEVLGNKARRILIVVDNLDRVDRADAKAVWASMRVFLEAHARSQMWQERVWLLVPFDPEAIDDLWNGGVSEEDGPSARVGRHFLEKTFQATFRVPPVILSDRRGYLLKQLRMAFPRHSEDEFYRVFRIYDRLSDPRGQTTPRNLKLFVNSIGALHRQWQDRIPLVEQAAFVLRCGEMEKLLNAQGRNELLPSLPNTISGLLGEDWPRNFAAMYFNVEPAEAFQVLLRGPVQSAIRDGNAECLAALQSNPGFGEVMDRVVEDICGLASGVQSDMLANAATAFAGVKPNWEGYGPCKMYLCRAAATLGEWDPFTREVAVGISHIIDMAPDLYDFAPMIRSIGESLAKPKSAQFDPVDWCSAVEVLLPPLYSRDPESFARLFRVAGKPGWYLDVIGLLRKVPALESLWSDLRPAVPCKDVIGALVQSADAGEWDGSWLEIVTGLSKVRAEWDWSPLVEALGRRIGGEMTALTDDAAAATLTLFSLAESQQSAREFFEHGVNEDSSYQRLHLLVQAGEVEAAAVSLLPLLTGEAIIHPQGRATYGYTQATRLAQIGRQFASELCGDPAENAPLVASAVSHCLEWAGCAKWRDLSERWEDRRRLVESLLKGALKDTDGGDISTDEIVGHYDFWESIIGDKALDGFASKRSEELIALLKATKFDVSQRHLYLLALADGASDEFRAFLSDGLKACSSEDWSEALEGETELVKIALELGARGLRLGQPFQDALVAHVDSMLDGGPVGQFSPIWPSVVGLLESDQLEVFEDRLLAKFNSRSGSLKGLLPYYGQMLAELVLREGPKRSLERIIEIIESHDPEELGWLTRVVGKWAAHGGKTSNHRKDWLERARAAAGQEISQEEREALDGFIRAVGPSTSAGI